MVWFYSSGAIEDHWDERYLGPNRATAGIGMGFGSSLSAAILIIGALVLRPKGIQVDSYQQAALMLTGVFPRWGFALLVGSLGIASFGAALEVALAMAYGVAQVFGWSWGENKRPREVARFALIYTVGLFFSSLLILAGIEPLRLTVVTMALVAASLPLVAVPQNLNHPGGVRASIGDPFNQGSAGVVYPAATPFLSAGFVNWYVDPSDYKMPYSDQWNVGIEQGLGSNTVLSLAYVGSHDLRLNQGGQGNTTPTPGPVVPKPPAGLIHISRLPSTTAASVRVNTIHSSSDCSNARRTA